MISKKLATLLTFGVMLGQTGLLSSLFAQADTQVPTNLASMAQSIQTGMTGTQVASVMPHTDDTDGDGILKAPAQQPQKPATPDIYTVDLGEGKAPDVLQVKAQSPGDASLFVNGAQVLRLRGDNANQRVKTIADKLNSLLVLDITSPADLKPVLRNHAADIRISGETLLSVDAATAKAAKQTPAQLAFAWSNRLRQAFGESALQAKDFPEVTAKAAADDKMAQYKSTGRVQVGMASWYGPGFAGRRTASGVRFDEYGLMAAHRTLPFGTLVKVINKRNNRSCYVRITDRGPFAHGRIIDLSHGAAKAIGISGVAKVSIEVVTTHKS